MTPDQSESYTQPVLNPQTPRAEAGRRTAYINVSVCNNLPVGRIRIGGGCPARAAIVALAGLGGLTLAACGAIHHPVARAEPATYRVQVTSAHLASRQRLAQPAELTIAVRNAGRLALPDVAVTITNPRYGTSVKPFATYLHMAGVESHSRAVWVVDRPPGRCGFGCRTGGPGGAVTPETHTWALGRLAPGATARFRWALTPVMAGRFAVRYAVAADLDARPSAVLADGRVPAGTFHVEISPRPQTETVSDSGAIVR